MELAEVRLTDWVLPEGELAQIEAWNKRFPVGQEVAVPMAIGCSFATKTEGEAYEWNGFAAVRVPVYGVVRLFNVTPLQPGTLDGIE